MFQFCILQKHIRYKLQKNRILHRKNKSLKNDIFNDPYFALTLLSKINNQGKVSVAYVRLTSTMSTIRKKQIGCKYLRSILFVDLAAAGSVNIYFLQLVAINLLSFLIIPRRLRLNYKLENISNFVKHTNLYTPLCIKNYN